MTGSNASQFRKMGKPFFIASVLLTIVFLPLSTYFWGAAGLFNYLLGAAFSVANIVAMVLIASRIAERSMMHNSDKLKWFAKFILVLFCIGLTFIVLGDRIKPLPFVFGLSILPLAVMVVGVINALKLKGENGDVWN